MAESLGPYKEVARQAKEKRVDTPTAPVCHGCRNWDAFGKHCWVHWEGKRACSHFANESGENKGGFRLIKEDELFQL